MTWTRHEFYVDAKVVNREVAAGLYGIRADAVRFYDHPAAGALKITFPRPFVQGDVRDGDTMGGQQYAPLVGLRVP